MFMYVILPIPGRLSLISLNKFREIKNIDMTHVWKFETLFGVKLFDTLIWDKCENVFIADTYDVVVNSGGMGEGHIPTVSLVEMIRVVKPGRPIDPF